MNSHSTNMSNPPPSSASKHSGTPSPNAMGNAPSPAASKHAGTPIPTASPTKTYAGIYKQLPHGAMTTDNTQGTITHAIGYIDRFLEFHGVEERFSTLTDTALKGDHFIHLWNNLTF